MIERARALLDDVLDRHDQDLADAMAAMRRAYALLERATSILSRFEGQSTMFGDDLLVRLDDPVLAGALREPAVPRLGWFG